MYCDTVTLGVATWTAAFLSLYYARIKMKDVHKEPMTANSIGGHNKSVPVRYYRAFSDPGKDALLSQEELEVIFDNLRAMRREERYRLDTQGHPGLDIKSVLQETLETYREPQTPLTRFAHEAFPEVTNLLELTLSTFECGTVMLDCVSKKAMNGVFKDIRAVSRFSGGKLHILMGCTMMDAQLQQELVMGFCRRYVNYTLWVSQADVI